MIDLTVAQIAEIVGGTLADISPAGRRGTPRHRHRRIRLAGRRPGRAVPGAAGGALRRARPRGVGGRGRRGGRAGGPAGRGSRDRGAPPRTGRPSRAGRGARARRRRVGRGGAGRAGQAGQGGGRGAGGGRADHHRDHRLVGKDLDQGLGGRRARAAGRGGGPARVVQQRAGPSLDGVARRRRSTDYLVLEMSARHPGNIAELAAIAPPAIGVVLNVGTAHLGEFGSREAIARTKAELPQAVPQSGVVILNVDDPAVAAMADADRGPGGSGQPRQRPAGDVWADRVSLDELARPRFTLHARRRAKPRSGSACTAIIRSATRCARARSRWNAAPASSRWPPRWPGPGRCRGTGCR